jgi:hypothetical protein
MKRGEGRGKKRGRRKRGREESSLGVKDSSPVGKGISGKKSRGEGRVGGGSF